MSSSSSSAAPPDKSAAEVNDAGDRKCCREVFEIAEEWCKEQKLTWSVEDSGIVEIHNPQNERRLRIEGTSLCCSVIISWYGGTTDATVPVVEGQDLPAECYAGHNVRGKGIVEHLNWWLKWDVDAVTLDDKANDAM